MGKSFFSLFFFSPSFRRVIFLSLENLMTTKKILNLKGRLNLKEILDFIIFVVISIHSISTIKSQLILSGNQIKPSNWHFGTRHYGCGPILHTMKDVNKLKHLQ